MIIYSSFKMSMLLFFYFMTNLFLVQKAEVMWNICFIWVTLTPQFVISSLIIESGCDVRLCILMPLINVVQFRHHSSYIYRITTITVWHGRFPWIRLVRWYNYCSFGKCPKRETFTPNITRLIIYWISLPI